MGRKHRQIRDLTLSPGERQALKARIRQTQERKIADRLRVIWYKAEGYPHHVIAHLLQLHLNSVTHYLQRYVSGGLDAVCATHYDAPKPKLTAQQQEMLKLELRSCIYNTSQQVIAWVQEQFGVSYSISGMHHLLRKLGFSYKKNRLVPSKADPEAQRQFVQWFEKLRKALGPDDRIYFGDAAHVKHNAEAGYAWSAVGEPHLIPTNTGRQRYNVLGAYCSQTHEHLFILTEENIRQDSIIELLKQLRGKHPGDGKLYLILDNASYNRAKRVQAQANASGIVLKFQPPYSPNLNLIERMWKFMRKKLFKDKYSASFELFKAQLDDFFGNLEPFRSELETLITEQFELVPQSWQMPMAA